jgi:hypothetical protein
MAEEKGTQEGGLIAGAIGGGAVGIVAGLLMSKPAAAAAPELKLDYLIELMEALVQGNAAIIEWLAKINAALGVPGEPGVPGIEVTVLTPWKAREPEIIFNQPIRSAGTFFTDRMVNWTEGKRLLLKVESSLDQAVQLQAFGNVDDTRTQATNIGPPVVCPANGNASIGMAWGDWQPYIGMQIDAAVAPAAGILTIRAVIQE